MRDTLLPSGRREMFERIAALPSDAPLQWIWAVLEQEKLWLAHDAYWVEQARAGWPDDSIHRMLAAYGLLRGERGSQLSKAENSIEDSRRAGNRRRFADLAKAKAKQLQPNDAATNTEVWRDFGLEFAVHLGVQAKDRWFMPSATLKAMWFHRPDAVPMYDQLAAKGLGEIARGAGTTPQEDFLERAYALMVRSQNAIHKAREFLDSPYVFNVRILDKFLWLRGNTKKKEEILGRFRAGCRGMVNDA